MIRGIGVDMTPKKRFQELINRRGTQKILDRLFHQKEIDRARLINDQRRFIEFLSSRWAVKEATFKALGNRMNAKEIYALSDEVTGKPTLTLTGQVLEKANNLGISQFHLSITHDDEKSIAFVVLEGTDSKLN